MPFNAFATFFTEIVSYQSCVPNNEFNATSFNFSCSAEDTHGYANVFENVRCLPLDGNETWEFTCPLYNTILSCASRSHGSWDNVFVPMNDIGSAQHPYLCPFDFSDEWDSVSEVDFPSKLPVLDGHLIYTFEHVVSGVYATPLVQDGSVKLVPSRDLTAIHDFNLQTDAVDPLMDGLEADALNVACFEAIWDDEFVLDTYDTDWEHFLYKMELLDVYHKPTSIIAKEIGANCSECTLEEMNSFTIVRECTNAALVQHLWDGLIKEGYSVVNCGDAKWQTQACIYDGVMTPRLCVGCVDPCAKEEDSSGVTLPTATTQNWIPTGGHAALIGFQVELKETLWPTWSQAPLEVYPTSVTIEVNASNFMNGGGVIYCEAVALKDLPLTSEFQLIGSDHHVIVLNGTISEGMEVAIDDLEPGKSYRVFCASQAFSSYPGSLAQSPVTFMDAQAFNIVTPGLLPVVVEVKDDVFVVGQPFHAFSLSVSELPESDLLVEVVVMFAPFNESTDVTHPGFCSSEYSISGNMTLSSSNMVFGPDANVYDHDVYMEVDRRGCYKISLSLNGHNSSEYILTSFSTGIALSTHNATNNETQTTVEIYMEGIIENDIVRAPALASTVFNEDGSKLVISFDSPIDRVVNASTGEVANYVPFVCSESFDFLHANLSTCMFTSDNIIEVMLPSLWLVSSPPGLPGVGSNITVLPNQFTAACRRNISCHDYPFVETSTSGVVPNEDTVSPTVVISASSILSPFHDLHLDVSASHGDGGRGWSLVEWMVFDPSGFRNETLENLLNDNSQLSWFDCIPGQPRCDVIARSIFDEGVYTFVLTLKTFLGKSSVASTVVTMEEGSSGFPVVYIDGPSRRVLTPNEELDLTCYVIMPAISPSYSSPLSFTWSVLKDNEVTYAIVNKKTVDPRRFSTDPFDLDPGHSYVMQVIMTSENGDEAMAQILVYVDYGDIFVAIDGGDDRLVEHTVTSELELDASSSFDESTGTQEGLEFMWTCTQTVVVDPEGCDMFNALPMSILTNHTLSLNVSNLLAPSSTYVFTLHIAGSVGIHTTRSVEVSTGGIGVSIPQVSVSSESGTVLDQNGYSDLQGIIVSPSGVSVVWTESVRGSVLSTSVNNNPGGAPDVLVLQPLQFAAGPEYSFRVSATDLDCSQCIGYAGVSVVFNAPPRSGELKVFPLTGEGMVTSFALHASGWLDENYPLQFLFYRDNTESGGDEKLLVLQQYSPVALCSTTLVAGRPLSNYSVALKVSVQDVLGSAAVAQIAPRVLDTVSLNTTNILDIIRDDVEKGVDFVDTEGLLQTLADIAAAFESPVFNCSASAAGEYSDDCVELAELGIKLIKAIFTMGEREPEFCNVIVSNAVIFLEVGIMPVLNTTDLINLSEGMTECVTSTTYLNFADMKPSFDFFIYANGVIEVIKERRNQNATGNTSSYPVFENVISVAQHVYDVLRLGETVTGYESLSMLSLNILKFSSSDDRIAEVGNENDNLYPSLLNLETSVSSVVLDSTSSLGLVRVVVGDGYACDREELPCIPVTGEVYTQLFISTTADAVSMANISETGSFDLYRLPDFNMSVLSDVITNFTVVRTEQSCVSNNVLNVSAFNYSCLTNVTNGHEYIFENVMCLPLDGNTTWEFTCPLYNTIMSCASRSYGTWENKFYPMQASQSGNVTFSCKFDFSDDWEKIVGDDLPRKLPVFDNHDIYVFERIVSGVYGTPEEQGAKVEEVPLPIANPPTMFPTASTKARSSGATPKQYTAFPAGLTLLGIFSITVFFLAIWISMAGKTPKIYSKKSLV